jgi:hypothetical protein
MNSNFLPLDVYCGKDRTLENNKGNKIYRQLIAENVDLYDSTTLKAGRMRMTANILEEFKRRSNDGVFKRKNANNEWIPYQDEKVVRDKISHALRTAKRNQRASPRIHRRANSITTSATKAILKNNDTPSQTSRQRPRGDSISSCPAAIEPASMKPLLSDESLQDLNDFNNIINSDDALLQWEDMLHSGDLDKFDERGWFFHDDSDGKTNDSTYGRGSEDTSDDFPEVFDTPYDSDCLSTCSWDCTFHNN